MLEIALLLLAQQPPVAALPERHQRFVKQYCQRCHGAQLAVQQVRLDTLPFSLITVETADRWQRVLNKVNSGTMPPPGELQPSAAEKTQFLEDLSRTMVRARQLLSDSGGVSTMRRLNRREYIHTIRDLLGVTLEANELPADSGAGGYDTAGASLYLSGDQVERYLTIGRRALSEALLPPAQAVRQRTEVETAATARVTRELGDWLERNQRAKRWELTKGEKPAKDFGFQDDRDARYWLTVYRDYSPYHVRFLTDPLTRTGSLLTGYYPNIFEYATIPAAAPPGDYILRVRVGHTPQAAPERRFLEFGHRIGRYESSLLRTFEITGTVEQPQTLEIPVTIRPGGERTFVFNERMHKARAARLRTFYRNFLEQKVGPDPALWIDWVEYEGPLPRARPWTITSSRAPEVIEQFATRAFRGRPVTRGYLDKLNALFEERRKQGEPFEQALLEPLSAVLASPGFLFLSEAPGVLRGHELANRLSYFLWSAPPDEESLAAAARLHQPEILRAQTARLLRSEKALDFITGFTSQWLSLERLEFFDFNDERFPLFDGSVKLAARDEVLQTVATVLRENRGVGELLKSDWVSVNALMANYYGLPGVNGDHFRRVALPAGSPRGGLSAMAAILAMGSDGERTSPVERGAWLLRKLLHDPPPPAPPGVPQLTRLSGKIYSTRELLAAHQEQPQCAQCHRKMDPLGFALENFDAVGQWRTHETVEITERKVLTRVLESRTFPLDPAGQMPGGLAFRSYPEFRDRLAGRQDDFARGLTEALLEYALGRPLSFTDSPAIGAILASTRPSGYRLGDLIHAIVQTKEFQTKK